MRRYTARRAYKVKPDVLARMYTLRASGKSYAVVAGLCGVAPETVRKWLQGKMPVRPA